MKVYFSDFFDVDPDVLHDYGAFNISLINDLPLFVDPFLLFNSPKEEYQRLHKEILRYVGFLRDRSMEGGLRAGLLHGWFTFSEVKQNWLGYSLVGNEGRGLGPDFARALNENLHYVFSNFGEETISRSSHLEKLCLIKEGVGRDNISDFTTNLIKGYLLGYTEEFAAKYISSAKRMDVWVRKVYFNYDTQSWASAKFNLPYHNGAFVLLTPRDILTKDETWINRYGMIDDFREILESISNEQLRAEISAYLLSNLPKKVPKKHGRGSRKPSRSEIVAAMSKTISKYPQLIDYYIRYKEDHGQEATSMSHQRVLETENQFVVSLNKFIETLNGETAFYLTPPDTLVEALKRVMFLKDVIENKDGYRIFYVQGQPIKRESDIHIMFRLTWYATGSDVSPETNAGRGPVDFKISYGSKDKTLVEFKLASNSKLKQNLENQVEIYKRSHDTDKAIKVILFFSEEEELKVNAILRELGLDNEKYIVQIDCRRDNKPSASTAR